MKNFSYSVPYRKSKLGSWILILLLLRVKNVQFYSKCGGGEVGLSNKSEYWFTKPLKDFTNARLPFLNQFIHV